MELDFNTLELVDSLKADLFDAFMKQSKLRADKVEHENAIAKIEAKLKENSEVADILSSKKYSAIKAISADKKWINSIEQDVADAYKKKKRRIKATKKKNKDGGASGGRMDAETKQAYMIQVANKCKWGKLKTRDLHDHLVAVGAVAPDTNLNQWLKALNLPSSAISAAGARKDGMIYDFAKMGRLKAAAQK